MPAGANTFSLCPIFNQARPMGSAWDDCPEGTFHLVIMAIFMLNLSCNHDEEMSRMTCVHLISGSPIAG